MTHVKLSQGVHVVPLDTAVLLATEQTVSLQLALVLLPISPVT